MEKLLREILGTAYQAQAMGMPVMAEALARFQEAAADPAFVAYAKAEMKRFDAVKQQCFISKKAAEFIARALAQLQPG